MADRRCFNKKITESDAFLDMPLSSQCLYFHLNMSADDDGFVNNPKKITRMIGANDDDLKLLITKSFVIWFETGVIVVKHWRMNNTLRNDRYHPTTYQEEFKMLGLKDNESYTLATKWQPNGNQMETELNLTKHNLTKHKDISVEIPESLENSFNAFKEMRIKIKKPLTDSAIKLLLSKLDSMANDDETKCKILDQSTLNCWQGVYPLKDEPKKEEFKNMYEADY